MSIFPVGTFSLDFGDTETHHDHVFCQFVPKLTMKAVVHVNYGY